ncbi:hypothetical protein PENSPDRAFT_647967 [Peniophora sp. CONT]|nr:hypothetical protein PENSPDRAFT_647967 [Peniophora sp. CONT]
MLSEAELVLLAYTTDPPSGEDDEEIRRAKRKNPHALNGSEMRLRHYQPWLKLRAGYDLRPRYHHNWQPPKYGSQWGEDCVERMRGWCFDAIRISDGRQVFCKSITNEDRVLRHLEIIRFLSSEALRRDPRNHTVPILDEFTLPNSGGELVLVMPFMRRWRSPNFDTVGEAVEFFRQIFEGIQFMHEHNVSYGYPWTLDPSKFIEHSRSDRSCRLKVRRIMYDATPLFPDGFHPLDKDRTVAWDGKAKHYTRTQRPVRYYFVNFVDSARYKDKIYATEVIRMDGGSDQVTPEYVPNTTLHNPFTADVYHLGCFIRDEFIKGYTGFGFMKKLVADMLKYDPAERLTMDDVVVRFQELIASLPSGTLRRPVQNCFWLIWRIPTPIRLIISIPSTFRAVRYAVSGAPAIPVPATPTHAVMDSIA